MPGSNAAFKLFGDVHSDSAFNNLKEIQKKSDEQKASLDKETNAKMAAQQNLFFGIMANLLAQHLQHEALKAQLAAAAEKCGFANVAQALTQAKNADGQSPLQQAFQKQNFALAQELINQGAAIGPIERAAFDLALDSDAAKQYGFSTQYSKGESFHPVKNFGLVLGIEMTSKDGTFSQFGHIAPTYQIMTDSVDKYARSNPSKEFREIADAFSFSNKAAAFSDSTSQRNPAAGHEISSRIQQGKVTTIPVSFDGHAMGLSVVPDGPNSKSGYLVFTNRGLGKKAGEEGTQIYRVDDLSKIDAKFVNTAMNGHAKGTSQAQIMGMIHGVTGGKPPVHSVVQSNQKQDNCSIANSRSNIHGILLCQKAKDKGGFDKMTKQDFDAVKSEYKNYTNHMRADKVNELASALKKDPGNEDLNNLAKEYLKSHPKAPSNLKEPLEKALSSIAQQKSESAQDSPMILSKM